MLFRCSAEKYLNISFIYNLFIHKYSSINLFTQLNFPILNFTQRSAWSVRKKNKNEDVNANICFSVGDKDNQSMPETSRCECKVHQSRSQRQNVTGSTLLLFSFFHNMDVPLVYCLWFILNVFDCSKDIIIY